MNNSNEKLWNKIENKFPGIINIFETCIIGLKLTKYPESFLNTNFGYSGSNSFKEPLMRYHIYSDVHSKIFTFYFNNSTNEMFIRNKLKSDGRLQTCSPRIIINSINELQEYLDKLIIDK